jgi:hypothetical protein
MVIILGGQASVIGLTPSTESENITAEAHRAIAQSLDPSHEDDLVLDTLHENTVRTGLQEYNKDGKKRVIHYHQSYYSDRGVFEAKNNDVPFYLPGDRPHSVYVVNEKNRSLEIFVYTEEQERHYSTKLEKLSDGRYALPNIYIGENLKPIKVLPLTTTGKHQRY